MSQLISLSNRKAAIAELNALPADRVALVNKCRETLLDRVFSHTEDDYNFAAHAEEVTRDFKCQAAEDWEDLTVEEADELFDQIMINLDIIHIDDAMAYC